ncbi:Anthocyanidin 3-O-glucosyltransferase 2 [Hibiscus syriacus]|uniref:Glycosyltransferase n=1 Tax=Hibiscus syriacus TaxID=106335 RepID=A0A6A3BS55_HIBSY|nr:anthocyanidin 3-O-glucosyltransferase UFGT-like [Hibiscus syriacus]KAE8717729.1 Anthocyanidin 3-O-glucosyltransferase 2 [Hibiscus syriacus]
MAQQPHVVVLAFPFSTHAAPLLTIINRIASASPTTLFSFFSTQQSNNSIFSISQPNIKAYNVPDGVPEGYVFLGKPQEEIELFMRGAPQSFRKGVEMAVEESGRKLSCLVTDSFFWFAKEMALENGVPWLPFHTAGDASLSSHVYTDLLRETYGVGGIVGREDETLNFIPGLSNVRIRDLPEGIVFGKLESFFSVMLHKMGQVLPQATAVFINSFEELDPDITTDLKSTFKQYLNVGPLILTTPRPSVPDSHGCLAWLDKQKPATVTYISIGSVATPPPNELVALAEALETSQVPFIWSLRDELKVHLPSEFIDKANGLIVPWAPQIDVLAHGAVEVFITHGGWNSIVESIAGGVPMIFRPFFGDHRVNGRMVEDVWEIGVIVESGVLTKDGKMSGLDLVLAQEKGKKMRENLRDIKQVAQRSVGAKGTSTENFNNLLDLVCTQNYA